MSEQNGAAKAAKAKTEYMDVSMTDGRTVRFPVKRQVQKEVIVGEDGTPSVRFDFADGGTITCTVPEHHLRYAAGHGYAQKLGDEFAGLKDDAGNPASLEDKRQAVEDLHNRLTNEADWNAVRQGEGGAAGSGVVIRALMEHLNKTKEEIVAFIERRMTQREMTRQAIYAAFRAERDNPDSALGAVIRRLEAEKARKAPAVSAADLLADD